MSLIKIDSSKGLYEVLGNGLLANPVVIPEITGNDEVDTTLGFHLHVSSNNAAHVITLKTPTEKGELLLVTNIGTNSFVLDLASLSIGAALDGAYDFPGGSSVLFVSTGVKWSPTSQSL